jgi:hypothetical protein
MALAMSNSTAPMSATNAEQPLLGPFPRVAIARRNAKSDEILENAVHAVVDLLDPDLEPRTVIDAINLLNAIEKAIEFIRARREFLNLNSGELSSVHEHVLHRIHCRG